MCVFEIIFKFHSGLLTLLSSHGCRRSGSGLRRTSKRLGAASALHPQHQQTPQGCGTAADSSLRSRQLKRSFKNSDNWTELQLFTRMSDPNITGGMEEEKGHFERGMRPGCNWTHDQRFKGRILVSSSLPPPHPPNSINIGLLQA